jgi:hypothetical protein
MLWKQYATYVEHNERRTVARRESWNRFQHTVFSSRSFPVSSTVGTAFAVRTKTSSRSISSQEMITSLLRREFAHRRQNTIRVASEHNNISRLVIAHARNLRVRNELDRIRASRILRNRNIVIIRDSRARMINDVFEDRAESNGPVDLGFFFSREVDAFCITSSFDVEYSGIGPDVLVVSY